MSGQTGITPAQPRQGPCQERELHKTFQHTQKNKKCKEILEILFDGIYTLNIRYIMYLRFIKYHGNLKQSKVI